MKIKRLETFTRRQLSIVRVTTDEGAWGIGQTSPFNADITAQVFHRQVAPYVLGAETSDIGALVERVIEAEYKFPGTYVCRAMAGIDTALWDLKGKLEGKSVCEYSAERRARFPSMDPACAATSNLKPKGSQLGSL